MFNIDQSVMILIDVQGQLAQLMHDKVQLFKSLEVMIQGMKTLGVPIIWMEQLPGNLGPTTAAVARHLQGEAPIEKFSFSCCDEPKFMERFNSLGRNQVFLTGIETHICVFQTGAHLMEKGCQIQVVGDCVSSRTKENKKIGIKRLVQCGAQVTSCEMVFFELMRHAKADGFREIIKLIK